ncbi:MAG: condensation domain-containing protein, partial [Bdellovibrionota bacterium]
MLLFEEKSLKTRRWTPVPFDPTSFFGEERVVDSSAPQRELFSPSLMDADASRAYNHSISIHFEGRLDVDAIYSSLLNLIERHEALRGYFSPDGSKFRIRRRLAFSMPVLELSGEEPYADFVRSELDHVFDLVRGPLFRAALLRRGAEHWTLIFTCHHIIVDGWSLKIILDDLPKLYNALKNAEGPGELEPACSFTDYLASTTRLEKEKAHAVRNFWKQEFLHGVPALDLPLDHARPVFRTYRSKREDYRLGDGIFERLKEVGAKGGTSAFITLLSAFALYLHRISGQEELVVGVPAAGQIKGGKSQLLGHDARLLPIRTRLEPGDTFKTFSARVMETFLSAYEHQWICVPELMQELQVRRDPSRAPIAPVMFNFDPGMKAEKFRFQGLRAHHFFNHRNFETFELSINAVVEEDGLVLETAFNTDLFDEKRMHERLQQFERLVSEIGASPETGVLEYPVTTEAQVAAMDLALNSTVMNFERELCADQLIERTVSLLPENIAVEFRESSLSYREIWEQSGRVAYRLMQLGLGQNPLVGVLLERSEKLIPVLLGIWRAGGAFVPLDPNFPQERLRYIVEHSGIELILTSEALQGTLRIEGLRYEIADELLLSQAAPRSLPSRSPENLAYVIYT